MWPVQLIILDFVTRIQLGEYGAKNTPCSPPGSEPDFFCFRSEKPSLYLLRHRCKHAWTWLSLWFLILLSAFVFVTDTCLSQKAAWPCDHEAMLASLFLQRSVCFTPSSFYGVPALSGWTRAVGQILRGVDVCLCYVGCVLCAPADPVC
jgi:hypothetical protein